MMRIRTKIALMMMVAIITAVLVFFVVIYQTQKAALIHGADRKLETAARMIKAMLPPDFHDRITGPDSVSPAAYDRIVSRHNLLAEDNPINQRAARDLLESAGFSVSVAANGKEAVESVAKRGFDLVLMDVQMPEMDGLTAARRIRADPRFADLPIIALTAHAMSEDRARCLEAGMNDYIPKPIEPQRLFETLQKFFPKRRRI